MAKITTTTMTIPIKLAEGLEKRADELNVRNNSLLLGIVRSGLSSACSQYLETTNEPKEVVEHKLGLIHYELKKVGITAEVNHETPK